MENSQNIYDVIIAGGGPAGSSAAIHLARRGVKVMLVEQKRFPRPKLCGEFISPECRNHFRKLGVETDMIEADPSSLVETVFYSRRGYGIKVPSEWFNERNSALGLSRAEMDHKLLQKAKSLGVVVREEGCASDVVREGNRVSGIHLRTNGQTEVYRSIVTIDATGRTRTLVRKVMDRVHGKGTPDRPKLVAFKVHLENTQVAARACEIYSYPGGYGGLSNIEDGLSNLCFIASASDVRRCHSNPELVVRSIVSRNRRAAYALAGSRIRSDWLSVSLEGFGRQTLLPIPGLLAIGDAAAFIDPFTGSGMLMAFESGELASAAILKHLDRLRQGHSFEALSSDYRSAHWRTFDSRLRIAGWLRRAAFFPYAAEAAILFFSSSDRLRKSFARATRSANKEPKTGPTTTPVKARFSPPHAQD